MTGRRKAFFEKWAPAHNLSVEEAIKKFPEQAGIARFGKPEEIADLMGYLVSPAAKWMTELPYVWTAAKSRPFKSGPSPDS
jgi:3-oxoacyl-[acyl-carrier protein] reductase